MTSTTNPTATLAIRPADHADAPAVARLAALDSADVPTGRLLLGIVDDRLLAAVSLEDGTVVADPFAPTAELVALLRRRADRVVAATAPPRRHRALPGFAARRRHGPRMA
ncbi:MAG: hypothetical protein JWO90_3284 [Solirubrobacterales bacterium]|nr:hypothetical protein [Solirubrobacterales bacterium]